MGAPGCDDAPVVTVPRGMVSKHVTMIYPYYENPEFFCRQVEGWFSLPEDVQRYLSIIVVDDGSPNHPASAVEPKPPADFRPPLFDVRLFRIDVDVRWNWLAARNIGAHHAYGIPGHGWLLLTDMDHVVPSGTLSSLIRGLHSEEIIYRFSRREHTGEKVHPHPNSWFMTKRMYWRIGGYDEALSGHYGTDGMYRRRCAATAPVRILTDELVRHEYQGDSSTTRYLRKQPEDAGGKQIARQRAREKLPPKTLSFPYHEVTA